MDWNTKANIVTVLIVSIAWTVGYLLCRPTKSRDSHENPNNEGEL
jgi:hypothetical protein